jgi:hypothetical protein
MMIEEILKWFKMQENFATHQDLDFLQHYAENFEIDKTKLKIRKKILLVNEEIRLLGFNSAGIRNLTP